jgi:hypothetical protein
MLIGGCGVGVQPWIGEYKGVHPYTVPEGGDPVVAAELATVELEISGDRTFVLVEGGVHQTGVGEFDEEEAVLVINERVGQYLPPEDQEERRLERLDDGDVMLLNPAQGEPLRLEIQETETQLEE